MAIAVDPTVIGNLCRVTGNQTIQYALLAIAYYESGWNPGAQGDCTVYGCCTASCFTTCPGIAGSQPTSFGYLQLHTGDNVGCPCGLGCGYSPTWLLDPITNLAIGASHIAAALDAGQTLDQACAAWRTWTNGTARALYGQYVAQGITPTCSATSGCTSDAQCGPNAACVNGTCVIIVLPGPCGSSDLLCQIRAWWDALDPATQVVLAVGGTVALYRLLR